MMIYLNVSDEVRIKWGSAINYAYSLHLSNVYSDLESVSLVIDEQPLDKRGRTLYRCRLSIAPRHGQALDIIVEWEDCVTAINQCFAKAKRYLVRRKRGINLMSPEPSSSAQGVIDPI